MTTRLYWLASVLLTPVFLMAQSPQGVQLSFASNRTGRFQVWRVNAISSGAVQQVTTGGGGNQESREPTWSKSGRIAYQFGASGVRGIHIIKPDGSGDVRLTTSAGDERDPTWSPDARFIAYASLPVGATDYDIWIHDTNGTYDDTSDDQDYVLLALPSTQDLRPAWSPNGTSIAFVTSGQIASVPVKFNPSSGHIEVNGSVKMLTSNSFINSHPSWSPDSKQIAYATTRNGNNDIYRMSAPRQEKHSKPGSPRIRGTTSTLRGRLMERLSLSRRTVMEIRKSIECPRSAEKPILQTWCG